MQRLLIDCKRLHHLALGLFFDAVWLSSGYLRLDIVAPAGSIRGLRFTLWYAKWK